MTTHAEFDPGPPQAVADHLAQVPAPSDPAAFWTNWGPIFYRGRLDGSARILCIASDPGPTERIAHRTLVGDAGQRVQGFLAKLGLTRSYLCVNAFPYALHPSHGGDAQQLLSDTTQKNWRNKFYDLVAPPHVQVIVAFGTNARLAVDMWSSKPNVPIKKVPHPSSHDEQALLTAWRAAIPDLRNTVTPDPDGNAGGPNYGSSFKEADYAAIPRRDLPFGVPSFLGDDAAGRKATPRHNNAVARPSPDDGRTLIWIAPKGGSG
ncbi:MAG TPA: hypothetical protein VF101_08615 [Gaiellaceae bacterium]